MTPEQKKVYTMLDRKASAIVTKLKNSVTAHGYYENLGQKELRNYMDCVNPYYDLLDYQSRFQLIDMLTKAIDTI